MNKRVDGRLRKGRFLFGRFLIIFLLPLLPLEAVAGAMTAPCTMAMGMSNTATEDSATIEDSANNAQEANQSHATAKSHSAPCHSALCALDCLAASAATLTSTPPAIVVYAKAVHPHLFFPASSSLSIAPLQDPPKIHL